VPIENSSDPLTIVGFEMEQMILPQLKGPHVPKVHAIGQFEARPYIVMEQIDGSSLLGSLDKAPLPIDEVVQIGIALAEALDDIHRQHVIHFDIKPSNVMRRANGTAVLIDFGLAKHEKMPDLLAEEFRIPMGTAPYIAPEQIERHRDDPRSDLFAAAVLLYHLTTGQRPFGYPRSSAGLRKRLWRDPVPPRALNPACPPFLQEVILRDLAPDPEARHPTAAQLAFDLKHPDEVRLTERARKEQRDSYWQALKRRYAMRFNDRAAPPSMAERLSIAPIIMVAIDVGGAADQFAEAQRHAVERALTSVRRGPGASGNAANIRLACVNVLKTSRLAPVYPLDEEGRNIHAMRLVALKEWARPLALGTAELTIHVLESPDLAAALVDFATVNRVDQIILGAGRASGAHLGPVATRVAAESPCTVTLVKARHA
jgi:nucleotide-binding universal stress UspA family protein